MKEEYLLYPADYLQPPFMNESLRSQMTYTRDIIMESLQFLVDKQRIELNVFVIMNNHIHLIWQALRNFTPSQNQASFMKFTAHN